MPYTVILFLSMKMNTVKIKPKNTVILYTDVCSLSYGLLQGAGG
jgi:hypothetical protein